MGLLDDMLARLRGTQEDNPAGPEAKPDEKETQEEQEEPKKKPYGAFGEDYCDSSKKILEESVTS